MSAFVEWFKDYSFVYQDSSTVVVVPEQLALNASPFNFGQFTVTGRSWNPASGTGGIKVFFETSVDGSNWTRQSGGVGLTPSAPSRDVVLKDADADGSTPGVARLIRPVFQGDDSTNAGTVHIAITGLLKNI